MQLIRPIANPVHYVPIDPPGIAKYVSRHYNDYLTHKTVDDWEAPHKPYKQPWMQADVIRQQFLSDTNPIEIYLLRCDGTIAYEGTFTQKLQNRLSPAWYYHEHELPLAMFDEGVYFIQIVCGTINRISELIELKTIHENSLLLEYSHYRFYGDVIFETGIQFSLRILGAITKKLTPASKDTTYEDQRLNLTMLKSDTYRIRELVIGDASGIPDYFIDTLNIVLGCSNLQIDGIYYTKAGGQLQPKRLEEYRYAGWTIDMREKYNRQSVVDEGTTTTNGLILIAAASDTKGFGIDNSADSIVMDAL
jgi:hypothetical protein